MSNYTREPSFGNTTKITSRQLTLTGNSGFDCLLNATRPLTIEAPIIQFSTYPDQSNTTGTINFLKSDGTTVMAVETENSQLNMNSNKITGLSPGSASTDAVTVGQVPGLVGVPTAISNPAGTANVLTTGSGNIIISPRDGYDLSVQSQSFSNILFNTLYNPGTNKGETQIWDRMRVRDVVGSTYVEVSPTALTASGTNLTVNNVLDMTSKKIINLATGTAGTDAVNKTQMDTAIAGAVGGITTYSIARGGGSATAETTGQMTINAPTGQATIISVNGVTKATVGTSNLTMTVPIAMGTNKITGLTTATNNDEATNLGQVNTAITTALGPYLTSATASGTYATQASVATAIAQVHQPYEILRAGGSVTAETTGFITYNGAAGTGHNFKVNAVSKAYLGDNTFETYTDVANFKLPASGYMSVTDSGNTQRFIVDTSGAQVTSRYPLSMNTTNKIINLATGTANTDAVNKGQMDTAIASAVGGVTSYSISRGGGSVTAETTGQITVSPPVGQATIMTVAGVTKATLNTSNLTMAVPIAMGSNKITGLTTATNNDEATNKGQMDSAITTALSGFTPTFISQGGATVSCSATGQVNIGPATGQATVMSAGGLTRATLNATNLTMTVPIAMGSNKITGLTTATNNDEATNKGQMDTAITSAIANAYQITRASGTVAVGTSGEVVTTAVSGQFVDTFVGATRYIRTNANNGTGFSTNIKVPSMSFTSQPIYLSGPALGSYMDISYNGTTNLISGGDVLKTLLMDFATTGIKGKASGGIPFILYDYLGTTTKMNYDEGNDKLNVYTTNGIAMNSKKITGLATGTANDEAVNKGQMDTAISAYTPYQIARASAYVNCESGGDISYYVPGSGNKHKFYVQGTLSPILQVEATSDLAVQNSHAQNAFYLHPNVFSRGTPNTTIWYSAGTIITDKATTDSILLQGNVRIQPTTTNTNLLSVKNVAGNDKFTITNAGLFASAPLSMYSSNKITDLANGTASTDAVNKGQMDTAIASGVSGAFAITRGGGSVTAETTGQITINPPTGQTTVMSVNSVAKATLGTSNLTMTVPIAMGSNKITGLATATNNDEGVNKGQMDTAIAAGVATVPVHNAYEIVRGTTSLSIDGGGVMTLSMPINTASFNITDPSNTGISMSSWTTQSSVSYNVNRCRTRVQSPSAGTPYLQQWFNTAYGTALTQPEILSSTDLNIVVAGATDHINFRHSGSSLIAQMAADYFDTYQTQGHRIYSGAGALKYTLSVNGSDPTVTTASDTYSINSKTTFQPQTNSTTAFRFKTQTGGAFIDIDTTNQVLNMNTHKITGVMTATATDEAVNKGQMDTAIAAAVGTPTSITQGGGTVSASAVGQITINPATGQATVMSVAGVTKATLNTSNLTMAVPIAMGSNKITGLTTATNNDEATNKGQMDSAITTALTPYLTSATASSTYATQASVATAIANTHNPYELTRSGTVAYVRIVGDDVIHNSGPAGAIWDYYNGSAVRVVGSSGNEVYVADTGFRWRKGSSTAQEMFAVRAPTGTGQTQLDFAPDSVLWRGNTIMRPFTTNGNTLSIQNVAGTALATFVTNTTDASQHLDMTTHRIRNVVDPVLDQDVATKKYVDDEVGNTYKQTNLLVRNPDMDINQRQATALRVGIFADGWWAYHENLLATSVQEEIGDLQGFRWCSKVVTTGSSSSLVHNYSMIEGTMVRDLQFGYAGMPGYTLSAWVKSTVTNHKFCFSMTIASTPGYECCSSATTGTANTWVRVSAFIPAVPTGAIPTTGTGNAVNWGLNPSVPAGTTWGGTNQTWTTGRALGLSDGTTNMMNSAQTFRFTGFQVDVGPVMLPYRHYPFQQKMALAQRYYNRILSTSTTHYMGIVGRYDTTYTIGQIVYPQQMRITPAWSISSGTHITVERGTGATVASTNVVPFGGTRDIMTLLIVVATGNDGSRWWLNTNGAQMSLDADMP